MSSTNAHSLNLLTYLLLWLIIHNVLYHFPQHVKEPFPFCQFMSTPWLAYSCGSVVMTMDSQLTKLDLIHIITHKIHSRYLEGVRPKLRLCTRSLILHVSMPNPLIGIWTTLKAIINTLTYNKKIHTHSLTHSLTVTKNARQIRPVSLSSGKDIICLTTLHLMKQNNPPLHNHWM